MTVILRAARGTSIAPVSLHSTGTARSEAGAGLAVTTMRSVSPSRIGPSPRGFPTETVTAAAAAVRPAPGTDQAPAPRAFRARTRTSYAVSFASPSSTARVSVRPRAPLTHCVPATRYRTS